ncbi:Allergen Asp f 4 [Aspergillus cristatus]|uniref:Allergen Asp f 4 n=1 Tax=Aspergillus cristatus TaxID=573508 RepID=A0A1E3B2N0_ASPCR|nr:Allergen Asp f 4 [Aspergillus cristatus]
MQLKNSLVWFTALTAATASARLHGHERRHHHDKRAVGDMVYATINGVLQSWVNEFSGGHEATTTSSATEEATQAPTTTTASAVASVSAIPTSESSSSSSSSDWFSHPSDGQYTREGFGGKTSSSGGGGTIFYAGNVGDPWGSNIIEVTEEKAPQYKHVVQFKGSNSDPWTVVFWNKIGPDGKLTGWYGHSALKFTLEPGEVRYVAFDDDTQGGWAAAQGEDIPKDQFGGWSSTWGEMDFSSSANNGWSGWDVSCIQAQAAKQAIQGMKICTHDNQKCSTITGNAATVENAYTEALKAVNGIGGNEQSGAVRLVAELDFN